MPNIDEWLRLLQSDREEIQIRAASALLERSAELPFTILLQIFDKLPLKVKAKSALLRRADPELCSAMVDILSTSNNSSNRQLACEMLGEIGDRRATDALLAALQDRFLHVRIAAGHALADIKDPRSIDELRRINSASTRDDVNFRRALRRALKNLGLQVGAMPE